MFARAYTAVALLFALPLLAVATPAGMIESRQVAAGAIPASQCNTGDLQCCNSVQSVSDFRSSISATSSYRLRLGYARPRALQRVCY